MDQEVSMEILVQEGACGEGGHGRDQLMAWRAGRGRHGLTQGLRMQNFLLKEDALRAAPWLCLCYIGPGRHRVSACGSLWEQLSAGAGGRSSAWELGKAVPGTSLAWGFPGRAGPAQAVQGCCSGPSVSLASCWAVQVGGAGSRFWSERKLSAVQGGEQDRHGR